RHNAAPSAPDPGRSGRPSTTLRACAPGRRDPPKERPLAHEAPQLPRANRAPARLSPKAVSQEAAASLRIPQRTPPSRGREEEGRAAQTHSFATPMPRLVSEDGQVVDVQRRRLIGAV